MVVSILRLGKKYVIPHFESEALFRLHHDYPKTVECWNSLWNDSVTMLENDVADVIDLAHEFQLFTVLPSAYADYLIGATPVCSLASFSMKSCLIDI